MPQAFAPAKTDHSTDPGKGNSVDLTVDYVVKETEAALRDEGAVSAWAKYQRFIAAYDQTHNAAIDPQGSMRISFSKATLDRLTKDGMIPALALQQTSEVQTSDPVQKLVNEVKGKISKEGSGKAWAYYNEQIKAFYSSHLDGGTDPDGSKTKEFARRTYELLIARDHMLPALKLASAIPAARHDAVDSKHPIEHSVAQPAESPAPRSAVRPAAAATQTDSDYDRLKRKFGLYNKNVKLIKDSK